MKNCMSRLRTGPFCRPLLVETFISRRWHKHLRGPPRKLEIAKNVLSTFLPPPPPPPLPQNLKKVGFKWGWVWGGGSGPKTHWGMCLLGKIMILQGVKPTIQPPGVGYANRPKTAQNGGVCGVFPDIRLPSFDLMTSAR